MRRVSRAFRLGGKRRTSRPRRQGVSVRLRPCAVRGHGGIVVGAGHALPLRRNHRTSCQLVLRTRLFERAHGGVVVGAGHALPLPLNAAGSTIPPSAGLHPSIRPAAYSGCLVHLISSQAFRYSLRLFLRSHDRPSPSSVEFGQFFDPPSSWKGDGW